MFGFMSAHCDLSLNLRPARYGFVAIFSMEPSSLPPRSAQERVERHRQHWQDGRYQARACFRLFFCRDSAEARLLPVAVTSRGIAVSGRASS